MWGAFLWVRYPCTPEILKPKASVSATQKPQPSTLHPKPSTREQVTVGNWHDRHPALLHEPNPTPRTLHYPQPPTQEMTKLIRNKMQPVECHSPKTLRATYFPGYPGGGRDIFDTSSLQNHPLSPLHEPLHWRAERDPKAKKLSLQSFLRKGVSLGYVGRN